MRNHDELFYIELFAERHCPRALVVLDGFVEFWRV